MSLLALAKGVLGDALMITGFVFAMMLLVEYMNVATAGLAARWLEKQGILGYAAVVLVGTFPGCLGAFTDVTLYIHRIISLGALVGSMVAASGDEAFVMLAIMPRTALLLFAGLFLYGLGLAFVVDKAGGRRCYGGVRCETGLAIHPGEQERPHLALRPSFRECSFAKGRPVRRPRRSSPWGGPRGRGTQHVELGPRDAASCNGRGLCGGFCRSRTLPGRAPLSPRGPRTHTPHLRLDLGGPLRDGLDQGAGRTASRNGSRPIPAGPCSRRPSSESSRNRVPTCSSWWATRRGFCPSPPWWHLPWSRMATACCPCLRSPGGNFSRSRSLPSPPVWRRAMD